MSDLEQLRKEVEEQKADLSMLRAALDAMYRSGDGKHEWSRAKRAAGIQVEEDSTVPMPPGLLKPQPSNYSR